MATTPHPRPAPKPAEGPPARAPSLVDGTSRSAPLVEGSVRLLTATKWRMVHPYQRPLEFNVGVATKAVVDRWIVVQYEAEQLAAVD